MTATLFQMGFRSGGFQPLPMQLGFNFQDFQNILTRAQTVTSEIKNIAQLTPGATPTPLLKPPPPPAPAQGTILGLPTGTVLLGGALLLGGGVLAAVLLSRK